jgi:glycosyltransferase involved in cell wall biosynthesis
LESGLVDVDPQLVVAHDPILSLARTSVVVPTLNEGANLPYFFDRMPHGVFEVILVDGHSTDDTVEVARELWPKVNVSHQVGEGKGDALVRGAQAATGDIVVLIDADGSNDPAEIPRFVAALLAGADFAKGSRFIAGGGSADITRLRHLGNSALTHLVNRMWGLNYSDLCYGYNAFWTRCRDVVLPHCSGFEVETLINIRAATTKMNIVEVPSFESERLNGTSNLHARRDGMRVLRTILAERIRPI